MDRDETSTVIQEKPDARLQTALFEIHITGVFKQSALLDVLRYAIDGSFRAMWRDAMAEEIVSHNPFALLKWPRVQRAKPDPFTAAERDAIIKHWAEKDFFYYPWILTLFHTGMRPSEASALRWADVDLNARTISISKSRYMGTDSAPKTYGSARTITAAESVVEVFKILPSRTLGLAHVFVNKFGKPINAKKWSEHNWVEPLRELGIRHRKFYATRHTFITEAISRGENPLAVAQYCGTSVAMIQADYCGILSLNLTVMQPQAEKPLIDMVAGPGFEPAIPTAENSQKVLTMRDFRKHKSA